MRTVDLILRKRGGDELSVEEIQFLVNGYTTGEIPDYQMSAFLMATFFSGMTDRELSALTECMMSSGEVLTLSGIPGFKVDKHSTGGVGDKTSLICAPIAAAADAARRFREPCPRQGDCCNVYARTRANALPVSCITRLTVRENSVRSAAPLAARPGMLDPTPPAIQAMLLLQH
jgi:hypothetical protein